MRVQNLQAGFERNEKPIAPFACVHARGLSGVSGGELVVQRDDDRLFAREIPVQQPHADASLLRDVAQRRRLVAAVRDHPDRGLIQAVSRGRTLRSLAGRTPTCSWLDILNEHVH